MLMTDFLLQTGSKHQHTEYQRTTVPRFESLSARKFHNRFISIYFKHCVQMELNTFFRGTQNLGWLIFRFCYAAGPGNC